MKQIAIFALGAFLTASLSSFGKDAAKPAPFQKTLAGVPAAEMPAKAADLVKQTKAREWGTRTVDVVKSCRDEHVEFGGAGITVVILDY